MITNRADQISKYCEYCNKQTLHARVVPPKQSATAGCVVVFAVLMLTGMLQVVHEILGGLFLVSAVIALIVYCVRKPGEPRVCKCQTCGTDQAEQI